MAKKIICKIKRTKSMEQTLGEAVSFLQPDSRKTLNPRNMRDTIRAAKLITKDVKNKKVVSRANKKYKKSKKATKRLATPAFRE